MSDTPEEPLEEIAPKSSIRAPSASHTAGVVTAGVVAPPVDLQRRQQCQQLILHMTGPEAYVLESETAQDETQVRADVERRPLLVFTIRDPLTVARYIEECETRPSELTTLGRATNDLFSVLRHFHSLRESNLKLARATPLIDDQRIDSDLAQWLHGQAGIAVTDGPDGHEQLEIYMHFPNMQELTTWHRHWQQDPHTLIRAVDDGVLEISDAAAMLNHGLGSYGYGRA